MGLPHRGHTSHVGVVKGTLLLWMAATASAALVHGQNDPGNSQFLSQGPGGYSFGYSHSHGAGGGASWQKESADASGNVDGSYGLKDLNGRFRVVNDVADNAGFRADVQSIEPGLHAPGRVPPPWAQLQPGQGVPPVGPWVPHRAVFRQQAPGGNPYSFSYDGTRAGGSFHAETGDASGTKRGSYGLPGRTVNYVADAGGFRASVRSNEAGVDTSQSPADVALSPGHVASAALPGDTPVIYPGGYPGRGATSRGAERLPVGPVSTPFGTQDSSGGYHFAYGDRVGPFHKESGDSAGNRKGVYGLKDPRDGRFRAVNYGADAGGFRAGVQSNEPGVDAAQSPADVAVNKLAPPAGGVVQHPSGTVHPGSHGSVAVIVPANPATNFPGGAALIPLGPPEVGYPGHATVVPSQAPPAGFPGGSPLPWSGAVGVTVHGAPIATGYGSQHPSGVYNFAHGNNQGLGPWQRQPGDEYGNTAVPYDLRVNDGRFRGVNYAAGSGGFRASVLTNEQGLDGAQSPADVSVITSPGSAGLAPGGFPGHYGSAGAPVFVSTPPAYPGAGGPLSTGHGTFDPASGSYNFGFGGTAGGGFQTESGDSSGFKQGTYGLHGPDGRIRTVHYVADAGGFRANVQSNEPGVDSSKNPADVTFGHAGGTLSGVPLGPTSTGPAFSQWTPAQSGPWNQAQGAVQGPSADAPAIPPPQVPWRSFPSGRWYPPSNPGPGGFFHKTQVQGPQQNFAKLRQY